MNKTIIFFAVALVAIHFTGCAPEQPEAEFKPLTIDMGKVKPTDTVNVSFVVENIGDKDLVLEKVIPSCNCTIPTYSTSPIKPHAKEEIKMKYIPKPTDTGKVYQEIVVRTNAVKKIRILTLTGEISK